MATSTQPVPAPGPDQGERTETRKQLRFAWPRDKTITSAFRLAAFGAGLLQIAAFPGGPGYVASELTGLIVVAGVYTLLKIAQPFGWQRSRIANVVLLVVDIVAAGAFVYYSGSIESPFILYTLVPVLTAALSKDYTVTIAVSLSTAAYVLAGYIYNPISQNMPTLQAVNDFLVYLIALGLVAVLPYSVNLDVRRRLLSGAAADERRRISRELHDSVCQALCGLRWQVQHVAEGVQSDGRLSEQLKKMEAAVISAEKDARELLEVLHTHYADGGFIAHVKYSLELLKRDIGIDYELECADGDITLDPSVERELLMICAEALTNVKKHAGARRVRVTCSKVNGRVLLRITDDGTGFDESGAAASGSGHGLSVMRERAETVGGTLRATSAHGKGTEIEIEAPAGSSKDDE
jgi:signal transduction histidine kinase